MVYMFLRNYVVAPVVNRVCRPTVIGLEHVPSHGPAILASNHLSVPDTIFMPVAVPRQVFFLAKSEYFNTPGLKGRLTAAFFKAITQTPLDRRGGQASAKSLSAGGQALAEGKLLGIYPEGTRSPDGRLYRGKVGVARLALESGAPVIPVAMIGTDKMQPLGSRFPDPRRARITTIFGEPMDFSHLRGQQGDHATLRRVTDEIMAAIQRLSGQEVADVYATEHKRRMAEGKTSALLAQAKEVAQATRDKGRSVTDAVSQQAGHLNDTLHRRPHGGTDSGADDGTPGPTA